MARRLEVVIVGDASSASKALKQVDSDAGRFGGKMGAAGKAAAAGFALVGGAAVAAGVKMVGMASDAAEVRSKLEVTFGKTLPRLEKQIDAFAKATGGSRFEMRQQVADMGALLKPMLGSERAAGKMSVQFTKLASDLGSFNNIPTADALEKIRAGLVGEAEPLRSLGVLINDAAVKTEAYRSGLAKQGAELTEVQKVQARANLIMQQTTLAQGDATRTSGSMANQLKALKNSVSDTGTEIGMMLIPAAQKLVTAANDLIPKLKEWGGQLLDRVRPAIEQVVATVQENWPKIQAAVQGVVDFFKAHALPIWEELAEIAGTAVARIVQVFRNNEPQLRQILEGIKNLLRGVYTVIQEVVLPIVKVLFEEVLPRVINIAIIALAKILHPIDTMKEAFRIAAQFIGDKFADLWFKLESGALRAAGTVLEPFTHLPGAMGREAQEAQRAVNDKLAKITAERGIENVNREMRDWDPSAAAGTAGRKAGRAWQEAFFGEFLGTKSGTPFLDKLTGKAIGDFTSAVAARARPAARSAAAATTAAAGRPFGGQGLAPAVMDELAIAQSMGLVLTSGRRAPRFPGDRSHHIVGHAIDVAGSAGAMIAYANAMRGRPGIVELLHDPAGLRSPGNDHYDHVHVAAYDRGGVLPPGLTLALNKTGRNEMVIPGPISNMVMPGGEGGRGKAVPTKDDKTRVVAEHGFGTLGEKVDKAAKDIVAAVKELVPVLNAGFDKVANAVGFGGGGSPGSGGSSGTGLVDPSKVDPTLLGGVIGGTQGVIDPETGLVHGSGGRRPPSMPLPPTPGVTPKVGDPWQWGLDPRAGLDPWQWNLGGGTVVKQEIVVKLDERTIWESIRDFDIRAGRAGQQRIGE